MSSERLMILNMVSDGKLTVDEATLLLESIARLEINDPPTNEENLLNPETVTEPESINDTNPETSMPIEQPPDSEKQALVKEKSLTTRNAWESVRRYIQRFRHPSPF